MCNGFNLSVPVSFTQRRTEIRFYDLFPPVREHFFPKIGVVDFIICVALKKRELFLYNENDDNDFYCFCDNLMMIITSIKIIKEKFSIITIIFMLTMISMMVSRKKKRRMIETR